MTMEVLFKFSFCVTIFIAVLPFTLGCNGYQIRNTFIKHLKSKGEPIIKFENFTATLTSDCQMPFTICYETIGYRTSVVNYTFHKGSIKMLEGTMDGCDKVKNADKNFKKVLTAIKWPLTCPVNAHRNCNGTNIVDMRPYKRHIFLVAGDAITLEMLVNHDNGQTAVQVGYEVYKIK